MELNIDQMARGETCQWFEDDRVIIAETKDSLQKAAQKLNQVIAEYGLNVSVQRTELVAFKM